MKYRLGRVAGFVCLGHILKCLHGIMLVWPKKILTDIFSYQLDPSHILKCLQVSLAEITFAHV
jgi:hypothetical protein